MKVLVLRTGGGIGGAEIYNLNLLKGFRKYYPEVKLFFLTANPDFAHLLKKANGKVVYLPVFNEEVGSKRGLVRFLFAFPKYFIFYTKEIINLRFKERIKTAFIHSLTEKIFLTPLFKILKFRVIWLEHGPVFAFMMSKISLSLYRLTSNLAYRIIVVSKDAQTDLINNGIRKGNVFCIQTGVDIRYFQPQKTKKTYYTIGYLGNLVEEKGVKDFTSVGKLILLKENNIKFILVGPGKFYIKSKHYCFPGFQKDVRPYLKNFDIFFFATYREGLSLALLEVMAMGIPVVARDIGGNRELVINNKTGILFTKETHEELAEILINLLHDKKKRQQMGLWARKLAVEKFNQKIWIEKIYQLFR